VTRSSGASRPTRGHVFARLRPHVATALVASLLLLVAGAAPQPAAARTGDPDTAHIAAASAALLPAAARPAPEERRAPDAGFLRQALASASAQPGRAVRATTQSPAPNPARAGIARWTFAHSTSTSFS
jgi:hypothetical protein